MAVNILLADDHRMVREGLKQLLETDSEINVVAEAGDGYECLNLTNKTKPDIVLLDINMPNMDEIQVLNIVNDLVKSRADGITIAARIVTVKHIEYNRLMLTFFIITLHHCQFI